MVEMKIRLHKSGVYQIMTHYLITNLGYFGLLSTLVVILNTNGFESTQIAILVMAFTLSAKTAKIPLAYWVDKHLATVSVLLGCLIAGCGFVGVSFSKTMNLTLFSLIIAGIGISINALASKQLAATVSDNFRNRVRLFSIINIGVNISSAIAAPLALYFVSYKYDIYIIRVVAMIYIIAGIVTYINFSKFQPKDASPNTFSLAIYLNMLRIAKFRYFLLINFFGWILYGQLFNVLALYVSETLLLPKRLGWLYTLNALLVIFLQLWITRLTRRWQDEKTIFIIFLSYITFSIAFVLIYLINGYFGAIIFIVVFTLAEMMFVPNIDVLLLDIIGKENRAIGYSILSISTAIGEACGGGLGVVAYKYFIVHGYRNEFWLIVAFFAFCFALLTLIISGRYVMNAANTNAFTDTNS